MKQNYSDDRITDSERLALAECSSRRSALAKSKVDDSISGLPPSRHSTHWLTGPEALTWNHLCDMFATYAAAEHCLGPALVVIDPRAWEGLKKWLPAYTEDRPSHILGAWLMVLHVPNGKWVMLAGKQGELV